MYFKKLLVRESLMSLGSRKREAIASDRSIRPKVGTDWVGSRGGSIAVDTTKISFLARNRTSIPRLRSWWLLP